MNNDEFLILLQVLDSQVGDKITLQDGMRIAREYEENINDLHNPPKFAFNEQE